MKRTHALIVCLAVLVLSGLALAGPVELPEGARCVECGMKVDAESPYSAQMVHQGKLLAFCDIGDMLHHYRKMKDKPDELYVRDNATGAWTDARTATYTKDDKLSTPMGWGIAAFTQSRDAAKHGPPMSFAEALEAMP